MKKLLIFLGWVLLIPCCHAQINGMANLPSGYLYKVEPGIPGRQVYVCGEHPFNANGTLVSVGDLTGQTLQVFENIKTSLAHFNMTFRDVTQITYSVKGPSTQVSVDVSSLLTSIGARYFTQPPGIVAMKGTPKIVNDDMLIEVEVVAIK